MSAQNQQKFNYQGNQDNRRNVSMKNIRNRFVKDHDIYSQNNNDKEDGLVLGRRSSKNTGNVNKTVIINRETSLNRMQSPQRNNSNYRNRAILNFQQPRSKTPDKNLNNYHTNPNTNIVVHQQRNYDSRQMYQANIQNVVIEKNTYIHPDINYPQQRISQTKVNNTDETKFDSNLDGESIVTDAQLEMSSSQLTDFNFNFDNNFNHEIKADPMRDLNFNNEIGYKLFDNQNQNFVDPKESGFMISEKFANIEEPESPRKFLNIEDIPESPRKFNKVQNKPNIPVQNFQYQPNTYIAGNTTNYPNQRPPFSKHNEERSSNNPLSLTYNVNKDSYNNTISPYIIKNNQYIPYSKGEESTKVSSKNSQGNDYVNQLHYPVATPKQQNIVQEDFKDITPIRYQIIPITLSDNAVDKIRKSNNITTIDPNRNKVDYPINLPQYPFNLSDQKNWSKSRILEENSKTILPQYKTLIPQESIDRVINMSKKLSLEQMRKKLEETTIQNERLRNAVNKHNDLVIDSEIFQDKEKNLNSVLYDQANDKKSQNERYRAYSSEKLNEINNLKTKFSNITTTLNNTQINYNKTFDEYNDLKDREEDLPKKVKAECEIEQKKSMDRYEFELISKFTNKFKDIDPRLIQSFQLYLTDNDSYVKVNQDLKNEYKQINKIARRSGVFNVK